MKKIIAACLLAAFSIGTIAPTFAQTKKDGTKDMRYKKNKQPLKKDGTPDKRYKAKTAKKKA